MSGNGERAPQVGPQPSMYTVNVTRVVLPTGEAVVVMEVHTFVGVHVYFLPLDFARQVAAMLQEHAGGIIVPPMGPNPPGVPG